MYVVCTQKQKYSNFNILRKNLRTLRILKNCTAKYKVIQIFKVDKPLFWGLNMIIMTTPTSLKLSIRKKGFLK